MHIQWYTIYLSKVASIMQDVGFINNLNMYTEIVCCHYVINVGNN